MKIVIALAVLTACLACVSAQDYSVVTPETNNLEQNIAANLSTLLVESIGRIFTFFFNLFDIKVRFIRFLTSLYTADNLTLLKKVMSLGLRFGNWLYSIVPDSPNEGQHRLLSLLVPPAFMNDHNEDIHFKQDDFASEASGIVLGNYGNKKTGGENKEASDRNDSFNEVNSLHRLVRGY